MRLMEGPRPGLRPGVGGVLASMSPLIFLAPPVPAPNQVGQAGVTANVAATQASWPQFHDTPDHSGYNADERILTTDTVSGLGLAWSAQTGGPITSSPTVSNGLVYISSFDKK